MNSPVVGGKIKQSRMWSPEHSAEQGGDGWEGWVRKGEVTKTPLSPFKSQSHGVTMYNDSQVFTRKIKLLPPNYISSMSSLSLKWKLLLHLCRRSMVPNFGKTTTKFSVPQLCCVWNEYVCRQTRVTETRSFAFLFQGLILPFFHSHTLSKETC